MNENWARNIVYETARMTGYSRVRAQSIRQGRILMYHAVADGGLSPPTFEAELAFLRAHFDVMSLRELATKRSRGELCGREVALTFDDGVRNHGTVVYPILRRHAVPATYFVCPGLIDAQQWIWNMEMRARLQSLESPVRQAVAKEIGAPVSEVAGIVEWAKRLDLTSRQMTEDVVRRQSKYFRPSAQQTDLCAPLTWQELRAIDEGLVTIGSHTMTHPILPTLNIRQAEQEIVESKKLLESRLDREIDLFCYPNGANEPNSARLVELTYRAAVTTEPGFVSNSSLPYAMPRIGAANNIAKFQWRLYRP